MKYLDKDGVLYLWEKIKAKFATVESVPTRTSDLTNNSGFITSSDVPSKTSDLTNDSGFINNTVSNLANYYSKTNTYSKQEIDDIVGDIAGIEFEIVSSLPATGKSGTIYLISNSGQNPNIYDEYIWVSNAFEKIGTTDVDLSGYVQSSDLVAITNAEIDTIVAS